MANANLHDLCLASINFGSSPIFIHVNILKVFKMWEAKDYV